MITFNKGKLKSEKCLAMSNRHSLRDSIGREGPGGEGESLGDALFRFNPDITSDRRMFDYKLD
jgi:hypothetical protein